MRPVSMDKTQNIAEWIGMSCDLVLTGIHLNGCVGYFEGKSHRLAAYSLPVAKIICMHIV